MRKKATGTPVDLYKRITDGMTAAATIILAGGLAVAVYAYSDQEKTGRLQRTLSFITAANNYPDEDEQGRAMLLEFPDRYGREIKNPLTREQAESFLKTARDPNAPDYRRWNVARKHLNRNEAIAFAYVHELGDRELLAAAACVPITKSYEYFKELIDVFGREFGTGQSWQVIPEAVKEMKRRYPLQCTGPVHPNDTAE